MADKRLVPVTRLRVMVNKLAALTEGRVTLTGRIDETAIYTRGSQ